jgi:hypothetical protein
LPVLLIIVELSFVLGAIQVSVGAVAFGLVIDPITLIGVAVRVDEATLTESSVVLVPAFIDTSVHPSLNTVALADPIVTEYTWLLPDRCPLTLIGGSIIKRGRLFVEPFVCDPRRRLVLDLVRTKPGTDLSRAHIVDYSKKPAFLNFDPRRISHLLFELSKFVANEIPSKVLLDCLGRKVPFTVNYWLPRCFEGYRLLIIWLV